METNQIPRQDMSTSETGCCPRVDPAAWDDQELHFEDKLFVKGRTIQFLHIPFNMARMMTRVWSKIREAGAEPGDQFLVMSCDPSLWRGEHYFAVTREVAGLENVKLSGDFLTKVFEGPFRNAVNWAEEMGEYAAGKGRPMQRLFFYYTTCPKCAERYGKNYVVGLAQV